MLGDEKGWDEQTEVRTGNVQRDCKAGDKDAGVREMG